MKKSSEQQTEEVVHVFLWGFAFVGAGAALAALAMGGPAAMFCVIGGFCAVFGSFLICNAIYEAKKLREQRKNTAEIEHPTGAEL